MTNSRRRRLVSSGKDNSHCSGNHRVYEIVSEICRLMAALTPNQMSFIEFELGRYISTGVEELVDMKLPGLLKLRYAALQDGVKALGGSDQARRVFIDFQKHLY